MVRFVFWGFVWMLALCSVSIKAEYTDGLKIKYIGWLEAIFGEK